MARFLTTKVQLSGYRLQVRRVEQGFIRRDVRLMASPFSAQTNAFAVGIFLACLVVAFGFLQSYLAPRANQNGASMIITKSGGLYVMFDGALHPVTNLGSARLIVGKADTPKVVKDEALADQPRGQEMGIPSGPNNLSPRPDDTAQWTACDKHTDASDLSLTKTDVLSTTLLAGTDAMTTAVTPLSNNDAVLVKLADAPDHQWLVYKGQRTSIGPNDMATRATLGLTPAVANKAIPISQRLFNAIPAAPALTVPFIPSRSQINPALPSATNGDVIITSATDGTRQYHVALPDGVQQVSQFIAQLLINTGSKEITTLDRNALSRAQVSNAIDTSRYPDHAPNFRQPHVLCWSWQKGVHDLRAAATILTGESLPVSNDNLNKIVPLLESSNPNATANAVYTRPGRGWFVRVTGSTPESHAQEQLMWIEDNGKRYFIGPDDQGKYDSAVRALGIGAHDPLPIPWAIAKLYAPGNTLSRGAALTLHELLPVDLNQKAIPPESAERAAAATGH